MFQERGWVGGARSGSMWDSGCAALQGGPTLLSGRFFVLAPPRPTRNDAAFIDQEESRSQIALLLESGKRDSASFLLRENLSALSTQAMTDFQPRARAKLLSYRF